MMQNDDDRARIIALVRLAYGAFSGTDNPEIDALFADDVIFILHGDSRFLPHAGSYHGLAGIRRFGHAFDALLDCSGDGPAEFMVDGDRVAVRGHERSVVRSTGRRYETPWLHLIRLREGRIASWEEFLDTQRVAEAFMPLAT